MQINLPEDSLEYWMTKDQHAFVWRFYNHFGWYPDRDGSSINFRQKSWWITTDQEMEPEFIQTIYEYCEVEEHFEMPTGGTTIEISLDWDDMVDKINKARPNANAKYIAHHEKQYIHLDVEKSSLTAEDKTALLKLLSNYINLL